MTQYAEMPIPPDEHLFDDADAVFRSLFERLGTCLVSLDPSLRVQECNDDFCREFGQDAADVTGRGVLDFVHTSSHAHLHSQFVRLLQGRCRRFDERVLGLAADGSALPGDITAIASPGGEDALEGVVVLFRPDHPQRADRLAEHGTVLTELDARILEGVAAGVSTAQLAAKLYLSRQGIEYHVGSMLRKLKAPNRAALVSRAYAMGVLSIGSWPPRVVRDCIK